MWAFFGLTPTYKLEIADSIFNMITFGKGGWTYQDLYNMPVFLRLYYMRKMVKVLDEEATSTKATPKGVARPNIQR